MAAGNKCLACGVPLRKDYREPYHRNCKATCSWLAGETGEVVLIPCTTCRGNVRQKFPIHLCAVHETCLPTYTGTDTERMTCTACRRDSLGFEAKPTDAPAL